MYVVTAEEMRRIDRHAIETIGIPAMVLMENAGREIAAEVLALIADKHGGAAVNTKAEGGCAGSSARPAALRRERWLVLAGKGNNGGDGFVAARHLAEAGVTADVALAEPAAALAGEAARQREIAMRFGVRCFEAADAEAVRAIDWRAYSGVIDALLGTGASGAPREPYAALIRAANASGLPIVAADIPSGLDADTGAAYDPCIRATRTVALALAKRGLVQHPGAELAGRVAVRPIGIPARLAETLGVRTHLLTEEVLAERLGVDIARPRRPDTHKGTYGHALIAAGTLAMSGAGMLCVRAALRAGAGLATWAVPEALVPHLAGRVPEAMLAGVAAASPKAAAPAAWADASPAALLSLAAGKDALALGPGMGRFAGGAAWLRSVWEGAACPLVLDADALNLLADAPDFASWPKRDAATVLTPHPGEMARLARLPTQEVQRDRIGLARRFAAEHGVTLVLKGAGTVVATPAGDVYVNASGNPGMATGGAGDVLTGIVAGLLAQGLSAEQAAAFGVYLHGAAGDRAAARRPAAASLIAGDIVEEL